MIAIFSSRIVPKAAQVSEPCNVQNTITEGDRREVNGYQDTLEVRFLCIFDSSSTCNRGIVVYFVFKLVCICNR